jgi:hypothetical protein
MAPRLHRSVRHDQEEDQDHGLIRCDGRPVPARPPPVQPTHGDGTPIPVRYVNEVEMAMLLDLCGVNDLAAVEGANDRTVRLSDRSELVCPAHERTLKPDACRSCRFLAGE